MQFPEIETKKVVVLGVGIVILLGLAWVMLSFPGPQVVRAWFSDPVVSAGSKTMLNVEVNNLLESDVKELTVSVEPKDNETVLVLTGPTKTLTYFGKGESRVLQFPVMIGGNAVAGRYSVVVKVLLDGKEYQETVFVEVKK